MTELQRLKQLMDRRRNVARELVKIQSEIKPNPTKNSPVLLGMKSRMNEEMAWLDSTIETFGIDVRVQEAINRNKGKEDG